MVLMIREDDVARRYFAAEAARAVVHAGKRLWWAAVGVACISALLKLVVDLPARGESLTRPLLAVPFFGALAVPLTWLAYRWLPCSCTVDERGFRVRGRYAGHYHFNKIVSYSLEAIPSLPGYKLLTLRVTNRARAVGIVVVPSTGDDTLREALDKIAS